MSFVLMKTVSSVNAACIIRHICFSPKRDFTVLPSIQLHGKVANASISVM